MNASYEAESPQRKLLHLLTGSGICFTFCTVVLVAVRTVMG